jgi:NAD(P)-dependent dehydrogenase (short-subunit alcohol dehydrogenase family)
MDTLNGEVVLITGAKGGLGTHVTSAFLAAGASVAGVSRSISPHDFDHPNFAAFPAELSSDQAALAMVEQVLARFQRIDALVHLVGGFAGGTRIEETKSRTFDQMFDLNVKSAFYVIGAVLPHMRARGSGRILTISGRAGVEPAFGIGVYSASKAALISLTRTVALENAGHGISANSILPGTMDTPANRAAMRAADTSKWVRPQQVAALLVYLASDASADINGAAIPIYGSSMA